MFHSFLDNGGVSIHHIVENPFPSVELFVNTIKHIEKRPWSIVKVGNKLIVIQDFKITVGDLIVREFSRLNATILMHKTYWVMVTHAMSRNYNLHNTIGMCCLNMINQRCAVLCDSGSGINYLSKTDITKDRLESVSLIM